MNARAKLESLIEKTKKPIAIFDLDGTVFDVTHRTIEIIRRFISENESKKDFTAKYKEPLKVLKNLKYSDYRYSLESTLQHAGLDRYSEITASFLEQAIHYWYTHFFRDDLLEFDKPYKGAVECVKFLAEKKVHIVYLSGRDLPNMSRGTIQSLQNSDLPHTGTGVSIYLKPSYGQDDLFFKKHAVESIKHGGEVIATFDNEPANVKMFIEAFPHAMNFHVKTLFAKELELKGPSFFAFSEFHELNF